MKCKDEDEDYEDEDRLPVIASPTSQLQSAKLTGQLSAVQLEFLQNIW